MKNLPILLVLLCLSCTKEKDYFIDDAFVDLVELFRLEATSRGKDVSDALNTLEITFLDLGNAVIGQCQKSENNHSIFIDFTNWEKMNTMEKELLLFHELGHCILAREHLDRKNVNGMCESIMRGTTAVCNLLYHQGTRTAYLNELFSE